MMPFITRKRHEAEMAAKDARIDSLDDIAAFYKGNAEAWEREVKSLQARLDALTPARGGDGRFVGKGPIDLSVIGCDIPKPLPTPPETTV